MNSYTKNTLYTNNTSSIFHNRDYILFATTEEILFILHVVNGIHITIQVYLHKFE